MVKNNFDIEVPCPAPELGDYYSPFYRVKFFSSIPTLREFEKSENERRRENQQAQIAFTIDKQPPISGKQYEEERVNRSALDRAQQKLLDSRSIDNYISELEIVYISSNTTKMSLTLAPPYDVAVDILNDRVIQFNSLALVEFGYASADDKDILSGPFLFQLSNPNAEFGEQITITLEGNDILSHNFMRRANFEKWSRGAYPTDLKIIEKMAKELDLTLNTKRLAEDSPLRKTKKNALEHTESNDWVFFQKIIKANQVSFLLCGKTLHLFSRGITKVTARPVYRFVYRAPLVDKFDVPIMSLSFSSKKDLFASRKAKNITKVTPSRDGGGVTKEVIRSDSSPSLGENTYAGNTGDEEVTDTSIGPVKTNKALASGQTGSVVSGSENDDLLLGRIKSLAEEGQFNSGISGTVTVPGIPGLRPLKKVIIDGVPDYYRGEYIVNKITHRIGSNGFSSEVEVKSNGFKKDIKGTKKTKGQSSNQTKVGLPVLTPDKVSGK